MLQCYSQFPTVNVKFNMWDPSGDVNGIPRNATNWDSDLTVGAGMDPDTTDHVLVQRVGLAALPQEA